MTLDFDRLAREKALPATFGKIAPASGRPTLVLLGGQPGAGKTRALDAIARAHQDIAAVTGDDFRIHHPNFVELAKADPLGMPNTTSAVASPLVRRCLDHALGKRYDEAGQLVDERGDQYSVLLEGVFSRPEMVLSTVEEFSAAGFDVHAYAMAVPEHLSRLSAEYRYLAASSPYAARWTPPTAHDRAFSTLPETAAALEQSPLVSHIEVWTRTGPIHVGDRGPDAVGSDSAVDHVLAGRRAALDPEAWTESYAALRRIAEQHQVPQLRGFAPVPYLADARVQIAWQQLDDQAEQLGEPQRALPPALPNPRDLARASFPDPTPVLDGRTAEKNSRRTPPLQAEYTSDQGIDYS